MSKAADVPYATTLLVRDTCLCLHAQRAARALARRKLVKVMVDPDDKRGRLIALTPNGKRLLARAVPIWQRTHAEIDARLAEGGADLLRGKLRALG